MLLWLVRLVISLGGRFVVIMVDSEVTACLFVALCASTWINRQRLLLRNFSLYWHRHPPVVQVRLVTSVLQCANPLDYWILIISRTSHVLVAMLGGYGKSSCVILSLFERCEFWCYDFS